jgi:hypothetical protein
MKRAGSMKRKCWRRGCVGLKAWIPPLLLRAEADVEFNVQVLLFAAGIVIVTGILWGVALALTARGPIAWVHSRMGAAE